MATARADSYAAEVGGTVRAGRSSAPPATVALVGDSLTALSYGPLHPYGWSLGGLQTVANCSVASDTLQDMLDRIDNSYMHAAPGLAGLSLDAVVFRGGTNNFRNGAGITLTTQAQYSALFDKFLSRAAETFIMAVPPVGAAGDANGAGIPSVNAWLASHCAANPRLRFVNDCITVDNGAGNWVAEFLSGDGVHFSNPASCQMGLDGADAMAPYLAGYASPLVVDGSDIYPATQQWLQNPIMVGTGGTNSLAAGGQVADGWSVGSYGSGFNASSAKVAADPGDPNQTPWQRVSPLQLTVNGDAAIRLGATLSHDAVTTSYPEALDMMVEIRFNAFAAARFKSIEVYVYGTSNEQLAPPMYLRLGRAAPITKTVTLRSAVRRSGVRQAHAAAQLYFSLYPAADYSGAMGSFDVRCASVRAF